jgi:hypothetical protein
LTKGAQLKSILTLGLLVLALGAAGFGNKTDSSPLIAASTPVGKIAFSRTGEHGRDIGEIYVLNPNGPGQRNLTRHPGDDHSY